MELTMKRFLKVFVPIILAITILIGICWYLLSYDRVFTQDMFLYGARQFSALGNNTIASWFYDRAYNQMQDYEEISIELADKYLKDGNFTKAEVALNRAIRNGAGSSIYIKLCEVYLKQDKLLDAVELLDSIPDPTLKQELDALRPAAPTTDQKPDKYNQYISVSLESPGNRIYVSTAGQYPSVEKDMYNAPIDLQDGENLLYAVSVAENGLPSTLAVFPYTIGGIVKEIQFQDNLIEAAVRETLGIQDSRMLLTNELWHIKEFTVPAGAQNYTDLQYMIHLDALVIDGGAAGQLQYIQELKEISKLTITNTSITAEDLDAISHLTSLKELTLNNCGISTVAPLSTLTALTYLDLSNNSLRNISALSAMPKLEELYLRRNVIEDLSALSACSALTTLDLANNVISSIAALQNLSAITYLDISNNTVTDISAVGHLPEILELRAEHNTISDISALNQCQKLTYLDISHNAITDLTPTKNHMYITYLDFSHNSVSDLPAWSTSNSFVTVDGSYNQISSLAVFAGHKTINNILMDYNENISSVDVLASCYVLIQVNIYGTKVKDASVLTDMDVVVNLKPV